MRTKKEYYSALKEGNVPLLEELAINAGYDQTINLSSLKGYEERRDELKRLENKALEQEKAEISVITMSGPILYEDPINYLRCFEKGFVRAKKNKRFIACCPVDLEHSKSDSPNLY